MLIGSATAAPQTARVQIGSVSQGVYTSGTLAAARTSNLGFRDGGRLEALYVNVGDRVQRGQVLAKLDPFNQQQALNQAQIQLDTNQAQLRQVLGDVTISQSRRILERDRGILDNQRRIVAVQQSQADTAIRRAREQLRTDEEACASSTDGASAPSSTDPAPQDGDLTDTLGDAMTTSSATCTSDQLETIKADRQAIHDGQVNARLQYLQGRDTLKNKGVTVAYDEAAVNVEVANRPASIQNARAAVANQQAQVVAAQRNLADMTLRAPVDGVIASITGAPGEDVNGGAPASPLLPGSRAQNPGVGNDPNYPGAGAFMVLKPLNAFQMVVPVKQDEVPFIKTEQEVNLHPDALPDVHLDGSVLSVAPSGVNVSGAPAYYVTVLMSGGDPRLRDQMTTKAAIITNKLENVLVVPDGAVIKQGTATYVDVIGADGKTVRTPFTAGPSGFDNTQVVSGLREGQQVLVH